MIEKDDLTNTLTNQDVSHEIDLSFDNTSSSCDENNQLNLQNLSSSDELCESIKSVNELDSDV
jgi:hypothetical protein